MQLIEAASSIILQFNTHYILHQELNVSCACEQEPLDTQTGLNLTACANLLYIQSIMLNVQFSQSVCESHSVGRVNSYLGEDTE